MMVATPALIHPGRLPLAWALDRTTQAWRRQPLAQGLVGGLLPAWGWRDLIHHQPVAGYSGAHDLPADITHPTLGRAWDFTGSRRITLGNWGNEHWAGPGKAFSITLVMDRLNAQTGDSAIVSMSGAWEIFALSTGAGANRLGWVVRGSGGAMLELYTSTPSFSVPADRPVVVTCTYDHSLSGADRIQAYVNGRPVSGSRSPTGDFSNGIATTSQPVVVGFYEPTSNFPWPGLLGGMWFHRRALAPAEVWQLHAPQSRWSLLPWALRRRIAIAQDGPGPSPASHPYYFRHHILRRSA